MSYPINYPTPQNANVQIFSQGGTTQDWVKPQGVSFVWFTLIGGGGSGGDAGGIATGGGSSAVTNFMCPAFLIPDVLRVVVGRGGVTGNSGTDSEVRYQQKDGTGYLLLRAEAGKGGASNGGNPGTAMTANFFTAVGFFQSIEGQAGVSGIPGASATTFLSGGGSGTSANYGYTSPGYFQFSPIIVGTGGRTVATIPRGGTGCGGAATSGTASLGGDGVVVIITW